MIEEKGRICFNIPLCIGVIWGGCKGRGKCPPKIFLPKNNSFFWLLRWRGANKKKLVESGVQGFMYIKDWFKPMLHLFLTSFFCKLKFPIVIRQIMPMPIMLDFILRPPLHLRLETNWASTVREFVNLRWWKMSKNFSYDCDHIPSSWSFKVQSKPEINVFFIIKSVITE
jgi:hypothetical protein